VDAGSLALANAAVALGGAPGDRGAFAGIVVSRLFLRRLADAASPRRVLLIASAIATALFLGKELFIRPAAAAERCLAVDGDTLVCNRQKVRLNNVYAPELNESGGAAAKRRLQSLVRGGEVTLKPFGRDRYGRLLAEVFVDGRRIEQADVGPRAGRGSRWQLDRHEAFPGGSSLPRRK